jgi:glucose-6-phosphate-specific signal transduction histidine kinase
VVAALLVPWTLYLAVTLPRHYSAHHYWLGWVGFDLALVAVLAVTGVSLARGKPALSRYAAVAATMLVMDAWFDVLNAATRTDFLVAALTGALFELPLAYLCWRLARGHSRPVEPSNPGSGTGG